MKEKIFEKIHRINCLTSEMDALYHQAALKLNIADSVMYVLYMIHDKGENCLLSDICKETGISKQTINSAIRKLENDDILYLERQSGKNKKICLTERGKLYMQNTAARLFEAEYKAYEGWTEEEMNLYLKLMERYNDSLRLQIEKM